MARLEEFFQKYARGAGVGMATKLKNEMQKVLSVKALTRISKSGKVVALTRAIPHAPPRSVTDRLRTNITVVHTAHGARVVVWTPYGVPLEQSVTMPGFPHKFVAVALENLGLVGRNS